MGQLEEVKLADPLDKDGFFRAPLIQGYIWDTERVQCWKVQACSWSPDLWPWGDKEQGRLITLRWRLEIGDLEP